MEIKKTLMKREVAGENFLVPVGKAVYTDNGLFALTELGAFLWDRLEAADSVEDLVAAVVEEYEVEAEVARADIQEFLGKLEKMGIM